MRAPLSFGYYRSRPIHPYRRNGIFRLIAQIHNPPAGDLVFNFRENGESCLNNVACKIPSVDLLNLRPWQPIRCARRRRYQAHWKLSSSPPSFIPAMILCATLYIVSSGCLPSATFCQQGTPFASGMPRPALTHPWRSHRFRKMTVPKIQKLWA